jgi:predicted metal-dependent hydrolase
VEYVAVHELVHIVEPHHGSGFWRRVERVILDFAERKRWLAESGGLY